MKRYPNISDHGLIGDLQTAALVTTDGAVDWFCCPRFDSPSVFGSLLDADRGGHFRIGPDRADYVSRQLYLPETAILTTRFMTADGVGEVHDFMPVTTGEATSQHRLVRMLRVPRGTMQFAMDLQPRFDYGRQPHKLTVTETGAMFEAGDLHLTLHTVGPEDGRDRVGGPQLSPENDCLRATWILNEGDTAGVILESMGGQPRSIDPAELSGLFEQTSRFWRKWLRHSTYRGRWQDLVARSAMTLKLLTYGPTGAPIAAATTGLPEQLGGERNWDYRYTWIRDASFSIDALLVLGYTDEAAAFGYWLMRRLNEQAGTSSGPLKVMYRVDGTSDLTEETLDHWEGWRGSRPVRIGNGAADQLQLDIYGEAMDATLRADDRGLPVGHRTWEAISDTIDWLCRHWDQPDEGIWETRGGRRNFTYGRFQCWVAFDRAIRLAQRHGRPARLMRWMTERDRVYADIMDRGWHPQIGAFTQHYDTDVLDSSLLLMPIAGFVTPRDPMWLSTLDAMDRELVSDSLVYRYNPSASPDGLSGAEGTFSLCTFWYVEALARAGRLEDAAITLLKMSTYANHLGLFSEEVGLTGEQLGNFPQAFSHLALISAAVSLDYQMDHGPGPMTREGAGRIP
jgi:GH15 family glucan-1,4-alpha-glucosidase